MKILTRILSLLLLTSAALVYSGCGSKGGGTDSPQKVQLAKLTKTTWKLTSATLDTQDKTSTFGSPLTLSFAGTYSKDGDTYTYTFSGTRPQPSPFPASGTWKFGADPTRELVKSDSPDPDIAMTYTISDTQLEIKFNYTGAGFAGGRVDQVTGNWIFDFTSN